MYLICIFVVVVMVGVGWSAMVRVALKFISPRAYRYRYPRFLRRVVEAWNQCVVYLVISQVMIVHCCRRVYGWWKERCA